MPQLYLNNFQTVFIASVKAAPNSSAPATELDYGVLRVSDGAAAQLVSPGAGDWYILTAYKREGSLESNIEVMRVTSVDNSVVGECRLTVLRGQEGSMRQAYQSGDMLEMRITAGGMREFAQNADPRFTNARTPTGPAGGVLSGNFPNPGFAQAMATAADLTLKVDKVAGKELSANDFTNADVAKLAGIAEQATKNATDAQLRDRSTHTGVQPVASITGLQVALDSKVDKVAGKDLSTNDYSAADKSKLAGITAGATANATNAELRNRNTHTGTQAMDTVDGLAAALGDKAPLQVPTITGLREAIVAMPANNIDLATANRFTKTIAANTTISISNPPPAGFCQAIVLRLTITAGAPTFWAGVVWDKGTPPTLTVGRTAEIAFLVGPNGTSTTAALISGDSR